MQRPVEPQGGQGKVGFSTFRILKNQMLRVFNPEVLYILSSILLYLHLIPNPLFHLLSLYNCCLLNELFPTSSHLFPLLLSPSLFAPSPTWWRCSCCPLQFQMAHLVPLKPYAAPVPRSQSLCDQPTKTMSAFPTQDPTLTPTPRPNHSRELVRQNSDPTSEIPAPQGHLIREERGPWIRLPDVELPPKVKFWFELANCL